MAKCTLSALESESPEMQQFAESVLCMTTSSVGVNRPVSKDAFVKGLKDLKQVLERVVVDSSDPYRGQSDWELAQIKVNKEIELQKSARKPAMTNAVLDSMKSFFGYVSSLQCPAGTMAYLHVSIFHICRLCTCTHVSRMHEGIVLAPC